MNAGIFLNKNRNVEDKVMEYRIKLYKELYAKCAHKWRDTSYENGHNGNWEESHTCTICGMHK